MIYNFVVKFIIKAFTVPSVLLFMKVTKSATVQKIFCVF